MITVQLKGGLGNQLFQYALGHRLATERQVPLRLDISSYDNDPLKRTYRLDHFHINAQLTKSSLMRLYRHDWRRYRWLRAITGAAQVISEAQSFVLDDKVFSAPKRAYLRGYWQHPQYFEAIAPTIRQHFQIKTPIDTLNQTWLDKIRFVNSVAIHIRRGDYVTQPTTQQLHGNLSLIYYQAAAQAMLQTIENPHFFVFSDDPDWVRAEFRLPAPMWVIEHNRSEKDYEDLRLMSSCQHHIIANSTFSWWAAWLAQSAQQVVIAPVPWMIGSRTPIEGLYLPHWLKLSNEGHFS